MTVNITGLMSLNNDNQLLMACLFGLVSVSVTVFIPHMLRPYPSEGFDLVWHHPDEGWSAPYINTNRYNWKDGESVRFLDIPDPPESWRGYQGLKLVYISSSETHVSIETAFSYPQSKGTLTSRRDGTFIDGFHWTEVAWLRPWDAKGLDKPIWVNAAIAPSRSTQL